MTSARKIALDTETTGLDAQNGDRIVEIGAVELVNDMPTGRRLHIYVNPERSVPAEAVRVHGLTNAFLDDKPVFADVAKEFKDFINGAVLIIHNAKFDVGFINMEFGRLGMPALDMENIVDTMDISRRRFPGSSLTLDALCRRFDIPLESRKLHGALLDAELLGEVWLGLNGGKQHSMGLDEKINAPTSKKMVFNARQRSVPLLSRLSEEQITAHMAVVAELDATARKASKGERGALWVQETASAEMEP